MVDYAARRMMMVDTQVRPNDVTKLPVIEAMLHTPRETFLPEAQRELAYLGENVPLGPGRVMLEPRSIGKLLDALNVQPGDLVLDIGCGYGYSSALLARMAAAVVAVEDAPDLADAAEANLAAVGAHGAVVTSGPLLDGAAAQAPYDVIVISGGAVAEIPQALTAQLREGGRIGAIFMEGRLGAARIGHMVGGTVSWRFAFNASAPLLPGFEREKGFAL
ncbi:MAG: methyltransferase domain-containing protein [Paracoccus sp. (in: a-proteobacteria)]|nr:methyltransferase domain-containing protein [Paracoccus sp. (in: a-proteobacteria)]